MKKKFLWLLCSIALVLVSVFGVHFAYSYTYRQWDVQAERLSPRHFFPTFSSIKDVDNGSYRIEVQKVATSDGVYSVLVAIAMLLRRRLSTSSSLWAMPCSSASRHCRSADQQKKRMGISASAILKIAIFRAGSSKEPAPFLLFSQSSLSKSDRTEDAVDECDELLPLGAMERIQSSNAPRFLVWIYTTPGPRKRQTSPSPEVKLDMMPFDAFSTE